MDRRPHALLQRLREHRLAPERDLSLADSAGAAARELKSRARQVDGLGSAWAESVPPDLLDRTEVLALSRGVLKVRCDDAATLDTLNHWLRAGGQDHLARLAPAALTRVRLVL
jgi:hypothetical protein